MRDDTWPAWFWVSGWLAGLAGLLVGCGSQPSAVQGGKSPDLSEESIYEALRENHCLNQPELSWKFFVRDVRGRRLDDFLLKHRDGRGVCDWAAQARQAEIRVDGERKAVLIRADHVNVIGGDGQKVYFESKVFILPFPSFLGAPCSLFENPFVDPG